MVIYLLRNKANGMGYVGATVGTLDERLSRHLVSAFGDKRVGLLYDALRAHGIDGFTWEVIGTAESESELWQKEREAIARLGTRHPDGYNQTPGGMGGGWAKGRKRGPMSEEERQKRSASLKGRRAWNKGRQTPFRVRLKMRGRVPWNKGIGRTEEEKATMRAAIQASNRHGNKHPKVKAIECDGVIYPSIREMERKTGLSRAGIYYRLSKGRARFVPTE